MRVLVMGGANTEPATLVGMLFMVIEQFKDPVEIGRRFRGQGRMLPEGVSYRASWIDPLGRRCFQVMEASQLNDLSSWTKAWDDLIDFEVVPVVTSAEFWGNGPAA